MADEVMTAVRVACAGRATAHVRIPEHADHAALKAAAGAARRRTVCFHSLSVRWRCGQKLD